jgi:signal transduction histidine kinase
MASLRDVGLSVFIFLVYVGSALWGLSLHSVGGFATLVWPPVGIAIAALYFGGYRYAIPIALGALVANLFSGAPLLAAGFIAMGNTLEAVIATYFLLYFRLDPLFRRLKDSLIFISVCIITPILAATIGAASLIATGSVRPTDSSLLFTSWWFGDVLGALVVGGFLLRWIAKPFFYRTRAELAEMALAYILLAFANIASVVGAVPILSIIPSAYFMPAYLWISIREGSRGVTLASLMTAALLLWDASNGMGIFSASSPLVNLYRSQLVLAVLAILFLVFASAMEERKQAAYSLEKNISELERALRRLRSSAKEKNDFITILAHELRNPLAPIVSSLELLRLQKTLDRPADPLLIDTIEHGALAMRRLLDDLLDISRLSRRGFSLQKAQIDLVETLRRCVLSAKMLSNEKKQIITVSEPSIPLWVNADPLRVEQILINLISNAIKYTPEAARLISGAPKKRKRRSSRYKITA